jgi:hypothetical protein
MAKIFLILALTFGLASCAHDVGAPCAGQFMCVN